MSDFCCFYLRTSENDLPREYERLLLCNLAPPIELLGELVDELKLLLGERLYLLLTDESLELERLRVPRLLL